VCERHMKRPVVEPATLESDDHAPRRDGMFQKVSRRPYGSTLVHPFLPRVSILTRDIDTANLSVCLSVRYVLVPDENGLTYRHRFFTIR